MIYIPDAELAPPTDTDNFRKNSKLLTLYERYLPETVHLVCVHACVRVCVRVRVRVCVYVCV